MNELWQGVDGSDAVISFDLAVLLDPAVCRPVDRYRLAQELFNARSGRYLTDELAPHRLRAGRADPEGRDPGDGPGAPGTLAGIYHRVEESMGLDPTTAALLADSELDAERRTLWPDPAMRELYRSAVDQGGRVVVVGDSHLPVGFLRQLLVDRGFPPPAELVVSSQTGSSVTGDDVWGQMAGKTPGRRWVHVGSDPRIAAAAERHGVEVRLVTPPVEAYRDQLGPAAALDGPRVFRHLEIDGFRLKNLHRSMLNAQVAIRLARDPGPPGAAAYAYAIGYGALGPFTTSFVQWLHRAAVSRGCGGLWFETPDGFVAEAYATWWGPAALPVRDAAGGRADPFPSPAAVASGWDGVAGRWDGSAVAGGGDAGPAVRLVAAIDPAAAPGAEEEEEGASPIGAFVDGRFDAQRSLFADLFGPARGLLEAALADLPATPPAAVVEDIRRGAIDFVADFRLLCDELPSTVAVLDRRTACENLVMVLNFPTPAAERVLENLDPAPVGVPGGAG